MPPQTPNPPAEEWADVDIENDAALGPRNSMTTNSDDDNASIFSFASSGTTLVPSPSELESVLPPLEQLRRARRARQPQWRFVEVFALSVVYILLACFITCIFGGVFGQGLGKGWLMGLFC
ncbi:hypothetical protein QBC34DRAFT_381770 [Podospora aff. communis PSN243]|uniref:Uncharacterized protein n=1 Tax=Podospora aff. communis PSN243 TaxID=3040156 RepID=A0AAV9GGM5_9PEZI|nr:hypothetical protein QBC34DRAFT_381770 [Podospora aff. communis PSN243]